MNEHDSERIAGLLVADGMEPTDDLEAGRRRRAEHVLHPGERRQQALRASRTAEGAEGTRALSCRSRSAAAWPRKTATWCASERRTSTSCSVPTTSRTRPRCSPGRRADGPIVEILEEHDAYPSALPARREVDHSAWITIQIGCDNSCAFCIVPSVRGAEVSRRMGDIVYEVEELARDGVVEITLLGQNVNSYGRDLGAGQYRPQFADLLRGGRRDRRNRADPVHVAAPEGSARRDDRGDGRVRERVRAPAPSAAVGERSHAGSHAPRLHRRRGTSSVSPPARAAIHDLAVTTDIIVGFPGETEDDFAAHARGCRRRRTTTPPTRSCSRRGRAPRRRR